MKGANFPEPYERKAFDTSLPLVSLFSQQSPTGLCRRQIQDILNTFWIIFFIYNQT